jgi:hypothetical protein
MSSPEFQASVRVCAKYAPPRTAPAGRPQEMQELLAVSRGMRAHGVPDFPHPNPTTGDTTPRWHHQKHPDSPRRPTSVPPTSSGCWPRAS